MPLTALAMGLFSLACLLFNTLWLFAAWVPGEVIWQRAFGKLSGSPCSASLL